MKLREVEKRFETLTETARRARYEEVEQEQERKKAEAELRRVQRLIRLRDWLATALWVPIGMGADYRALTFVGPWVTEWSVDLGGSTPLGSAYDTEELGLTCIDWRQVEGGKGQLTLSVSGYGRRNETHLTRGNAYSGYIPEHSTYDTRKCSPLLPYWEKQKEVIRTLFLRVLAEDEVQVRKAIALQEEAAQSATAGYDVQTLLAYEHQELRCDHS